MRVVQNREQWRLLVNTVMNLRNFSLAEWLLATEEELGPMDLVSWTHATWCLEWQPAPCDKRCTVHWERGLTTRGRYIPNFRLLYCMVMSNKREFIHEWSCPPSLPQSV
jgi:hypothetical protein